MSVVEETRSRVREMVEAIVERIRMLVAWAFGRPYEPAPMASRAAAEVSRVEREEAVEEVQEGPVRRTRMLPPSLGQRTKMAAEAMATDRPVGRHLLDPDNALEARILEWLRRHRLDCLDTIRFARPVPLEAHVNGTKAFPGLPAIDEPEAMAPYEYNEWFGWLLEREHSKGNDDPDVAWIEQAATALSNRSMSLTDLQVEVSRRARDAA